MGQQEHACQQSQRYCLCPGCDSDRTLDFGRCTVPVELSHSDAPAIIRQITEELRESRLKKCHDCQLFFRWPQLSSDDLATLYQNLPDAFWDYNAKEVGSWSQARSILTSRYDTSESISILDVGAFDGAFLSLLSDRWRKFAIEPSPAGRGKLRESNVQVIADFATNLDLTQHVGRYDVVTLFDVFEHLPNPCQTLDQLSLLVKPGGILLVSTGNAEHWSWRLLGGQQWYLHSAQHLCFATLPFFRRWATSSGMQVQSSVRHPHQIGSVRRRFVQSVETIHAWAKKTNRKRTLGLLYRIPGFRYLSHKQGITFTTSLHDHLMVVFEKPATNHSPASQYS